jgi:hypothetical protein
MIRCSHPSRLIFSLAGLLVSLIFIYMVLANSANAKPRSPQEPIRWHQPHTAATLALEIAERHKHQCQQAAQRHQG